MISIDVKMSNDKVDADQTDFRTLSTKYSHGPSQTTLNLALSLSHICCNATSA